MTKIETLHYGNFCNQISIPLPNGYIVTAAYHQPDRFNAPNNYVVTFFINEKSIHIIDEIQMVEITSDPKQIKNTIARRVTHIYENGGLDKYIERYEHMFRCFDRGNSFFEEEHEQSEASKDHQVFLETVVHGGGYSSEEAFWESNGI